MIRYFLYVDEQNINSFYNQLDDGYDLKCVNKTRENTFGGEGKFSIRNVIIGMLDSEGRIFNEFRRGCSEEIQKSITIEKKVMHLLTIAKGKEDKGITINNIHEQKVLLCGTVQVIECETFLQKFSKVYNVDIPDYESFFRHLENEKQLYWDDIKKNTIINRNNGMNTFSIMNNWYAPEDIMFSFIILNDTLPIIMDMSYKKITMTHSSFRSTDFFSLTTQFSFLGIATKVGNMPTIKPLALWTLTETEPF